MHGREPSCGFFLNDGRTGGHLLTNVSVDDYFAKGRELGKALAEQARQETAVANPGEISPEDYFGTDNGDMA